MRRLLTVAAAAAALSIPASVASVGLVSSGSAFAATGITCKGLAGTITGNITISKCTPSGGAKYATASAPASSLATGGKITWKSSGATTTVSLTVTSPGKGKCAAGSTEYDATGKVTAASTKGTGIPAVGQKTAAKTCVSAAGKITLVPATSFSL
jgi:hypothetical protein